MPSAEPDLFAAALRQHQAGDLDAAEHLYNRILAVDPGHTDCLHLLGVIACQRGRHGTAVDLIGQAIAARNDIPTYHANLAVALLALDRQQDALAAYRRIVALEPDNASAHTAAGDLLHALDRSVEAAAHYRQALAVRPDDAGLHYNLGLVLHAQGDRPGAIAAYRQAIAHAPDNADASYNLGIALYEQGARDAAVAAYQAAIAQRPAYPEAYYNLGVALRELNRTGDAMDAFERALALRPDYGGAHNRIGNLLRDLDRPGEAAAHYREALRLIPGDPDIHANLGNALRDLGDVPAALDAYEAAIALAPGRAQYYLPLFALRSAAADDPHIAALEQALHDASGASPEDRMRTHFVLGKIRMDLGQAESAFAHLRAGNAIKRGMLAYDEAGTLGFFQRIRAVFSADLIRARGGGGDPSDRPVFIIGMPRSGTSLVEQILASHPAIFGAGERPDLPRIALGLRAGDAVFPEIVPRLSNRTLHALAGRYLEALRPLAPAAARITDKMPSNFCFAGLIRMILPNARIIHVRRDPLDTCLSCYALLFAEDQPFSYDLAELGRYYRGYSALMDHWRQVLPEAAMLEVDYEALVEDLAPQARRLIAYCGLEWDAACLSFHATRRPVRTASAMQVRQPLYRSSIGRWRPYASFLQPLVTALGVDAPA